MINHAISVTKIFRQGLPNPPKPGNANCKLIAGT